MLFGNEKDDSFKGSIGAIYQSFGGEDLYPTLEEKAANLLYFITKNHSFSDGNKRIAAAIFLYFLDKNNALFKNEEKLIDDHTIVALTIMIAELNPEEKEMVVSAVMNRYEIIFFRHYLLHHLPVNLRRFTMNSVGLGQNIKIEKRRESRNIKA